MAIKSVNTILATIQHRRGAEENFDTNQMTAGEWAVSTDSKKVWMCFQPGLVLRMATYEAFEKDMEEIRQILVEAQDIQSAIEAWNYLAESYAHGGTGKRDGEDTDNAKYYSEQAKIYANNAEAVTGIGIMTTENAGIGKPDGETITADEDGTLRAIGGGGSGGTSVEIATTQKAGIVKPDGETVTIDPDGTIHSTGGGGASKDIYGDNAISLGRTSDLFTGNKSVSYGTRNAAMGNNSDAFGNNNISVDNHSFSEGCGNIALGYGSHAENCQNIAGAQYPFKISSYNATNKSFVFDNTFENFSNSFSMLEVGSKLYIANINYINDASIYTVSSVGNDGKSVIVNESIPASNFKALYAVLIKAGVSHAGCHAEGRRNLAMGAYAHVEGYNVKALNNQHSQGHFNDTSTATGTESLSGTSFATAFVIGNGVENAPSNAARIDYNGKLWCKQAYSSTGADYAELFEWADGNPDNEDRRGYFVTMDGKKVKKASEGDYILGIVSGNPSVIGNTDMEWYGQFMRDEFGTFIKEMRKETFKETSIDDEGSPVEVEKEIDVEFYKVNPDYDPDAAYTFRLDRPEWDAIGMLGVLPVRDDGTCEVGKFCRCADGGIASLAETRGFDTYMVIDRISENIVSVILK